LEKAGYTAGAKCLNEDLDALVVHLRYPTRHRRRWRSTNLLERSLGEVKRRTKVIGRFPGEDSCLTCQAVSMQVAWRTPRRGWMRRERYLPLNGRPML